MGDWPSGVPPGVSVSSPVPGEAAVWNGSKWVSQAAPVAAPVGIGASPWLPASSPLTQRQRARNDFVNPRANPVTNGWAKADIGGSSAITFAGITNDPDLGYCARYQATTPGAGTVQVWIGSTSTGTPNPKTWGPGIQPGQIMFARCSVKMTAQGTGAACLATLTAGIYTNANASVSSRVIASTAGGIPLNGVVVLEGIEYAPATGAYALLIASFAVPAAGTWAFVVGRPQMVVDPEGRVPVYIDGSKWNGTWQGTADNSPSEGWTPPASPPSPWYSGFNDNALSDSYSSGNVALTAAEDVALMQEVGATMWRGGVVPQNAWPTSGGSPNWRNHELASFFDALADAGLQACPIIAAPTSWMTTDGSQNAFKLDFATYRTQWQQLWTSLIQTWPTVFTAVEFGNEPNITNGWNIPVATYVTWMQAMYTAVKAVAPAVTFLGGSLAPYENNDASGVAVGTYLAGMYTNGAKGYMDAISVHPYPQGPSTAPTSTSFGSTGFDLVMQQIRAQRVVGADSNRPIWITEIGTGQMTMTERQAAQWMNLITGINQRAGDVQAQFMHTLTGDSTNHAAASAYEAVEYVTLRRKPVFDALRTGFVPERNDPPWFPAQNALLLATLDPAYAVTNALTPATGFIIVHRLWVPRTVQVTNMICSVSTAGVTLTAGQNALGIYSPAGQLLGNTGDQSGVWNSGGEKVTPLLQAPVTIPGGPGRWVWAAMLVNGTTAPKFYGINGSPNLLHNEDTVNQVPGSRVRVGYESVGARTALISLAGLAINPVYSTVALIGCN